MAGNPRDRIRLGVSSLVWGFFLSDQPSLERFLDDAQTIGYEGILVFDDTVRPWLDRADELKALLAKRNLELAGVILRPSLDFGGTEKLCRFMQQVDADVMNISGRDGTKAEWDIVIPALQRHAEIAHQHGIRAVYQHHTGWIAENMEDYERLLRDTDRTYLGVMIDVGHATKDFAGHSAQEFILKHPELDYVEFKDYSVESDLRTAPGRGLTDWPAVADALRTIGYKGWIVVEQNGSIKPPIVEPDESFHYIRDILGLGK